jgi:hypothetical protein
MVTWIFWLYIIPMVGLIFILLFDNVNPFTKENAKMVFIPAVNIYYFLLEYIAAIMFFLIAWAEFMVGVKESFKKWFL